MSPVVWDVVIVGAGYAGVAAANRLSGKARVLVIAPRTCFVHRARLHEVVAGRRPRIQIPLRFALRPRVRSVVGSAIHVDPGCVTLADGRRIRTRQIIVATGSDARPDLKTHLVGRGKIGRQFPDRTRKELVDSLTRSGVILGEPSQDSALEIRATGFRYSGLAERSQLGTDARGRVVLDENLQAVPGIWGPGTRRWFRVGHIFEAGARSLYPWVLMPLTMRFAHSSGARRNRSISPSPSSASAWGATMVSS